VPHQDAASHPNRHLDVHVFETRSGQPETDSMKFTLLGRNDHAPAEVPVVVVRERPYIHAPRETTSRRLRTATGSPVS
jgi:hypothetical protein